MIVYFTCQVTLCNKAENGCEGITPPNCEYLPLPNEDNGYSVPVTSRPTNESGYPYVTETMAPRPSTTPTPPPTTTSNGAGAYGPATRPPIPPVVTLSSEDNYNGAHMPAFIPQEDLETNVDAESGFVAGGFASAGGYVSNPYGNSNTIITGSTTAPIRPQPLGPENIFRRGFAASRHARNSNLTDKLTIGVSAEQLIVFAKDEKEPKEVRQKQAEEILAQSEAVCRQDNFSALIWIAVLVATLLGSTILLFLQNRYYRQKIQKSIKGFGPTPEVISVAFGSQF
uniref:ZP domain-containing protein n=1 Tax=Panagrolaimus sp. JU765 TaxID=591449 RepID=A0AC34REY0_9BILA